MNDLIAPASEIEEQATLIENRLADGGGWDISDWREAANTLVVRARRGAQALRALNDLRERHNVELNQVRADERRQRSLLENSVSELRRELSRQITLAHEATASKLAAQQRIARALAVLASVEPHVNDPKLLADVRREILEPAA